MKQPKKMHWFVKILFMLCTISAITTIAFVYNYISNTKKIIQKAQTRAEQETSKSARDISEYLKKNISNKISTTPEIIAEVRNLELGDSGYGFIITKEGTLIAHPNKEWVLKKKNIKEVSPSIAAIATKAQTGRRDFAEYKNPITGQASWVFFEPIPTTDLILAGVFFKSEVGLETLDRKRDFLNIILILLLFLTSLTLILTEIHNPTKQQLWTASKAISILFLICTLFIWHMANTKTNKKNKHSIIINDETSINRFTEKLDKNLKKELNNKEIYKIPTGIYLYHVEFEDNDNLQIIGYIWQRYHKTVHADVYRGIVLPQAQTITIQKTYTISEGEWDIIGWEIRGTLNQQFNYKNYPFDTRTIQLQLWPKDFKKTVILVPDFYAYEIFNPSSLPGINNGIKLKNWEKESSFFSYISKNYRTNFGLYTEKSNQPIVNKSNLPELFFNIKVNRYVLGSIMLKLFPIILVAVLLFVMLLMTSTGYISNFNNIMSTTGSLFFTTILAHYQFKSSIKVEEVVFFEYLYFILYALIFGVMVTSIFFFWKTKNQFISYKNMLIPQLLYWPTVTTLLLSISLVHFY